MKQTWKISDYRKSGMTDDEVIAACLQDAKQSDRREILFDEPEYLLCKSVLLPSDTTVILDGCKIKQANETFDTVFRGDNLKLDPHHPNGFPLSVSPIRNINILGKNGAIISGPDWCGRDNNPGMKQIQEKVGDYWGWRTLMISFSACDGLEIGGIVFEKTRCWCISLDLCLHGHLHDLHIDSNVKNGDGIDLRSGCHHFLIENITGATSDDNIACTALFCNDTVYQYPQEKSVYPMEPTKDSGSRTPWERNISDVIIRNVTVSGMHHGIVCLAANGCQVYDIHIENVTEVPCNRWENPYNQAVIKLYTGYGSGYTKGDLHDITVKNVRQCVSTYPVYCNAEMENVRLENIVSENGANMKLDFPEGIEII